MWSRTAPRGPVRRPSVVRAGVAGLAVLASAGLAMPAAVAAPAVATITLAPDLVETSLWPDQNYGVLPVTSPQPGTGHEDVAAAWGGAVTLTLPSSVKPNGAGLAVRLDTMGGTNGNTPTRSWSSNGVSGTDPLTVTDLGGGTFRVDLPAADGVNGPDARLLVSDLVSTRGPWNTVSSEEQWDLLLSATAPASVQLTMQEHAYSVLGCPGGDLDVAGCSAVTVTAGSTLDVALPATLRLTEVGIPDLRVSDYSLNDGPDAPSLIEEMFLPLDAAVSADGRTATLTVPTRTTPGRYFFNAVAGDGTGQLVSSTWAVVQVVAAPVAVNPGLRSETGGDTGSSVLLPLALGSAAVLAAGGVAVRSRRAGAGG